MKTEKREPNNRASVACGTTSSGLICILVPKGEKIGRSQRQKMFEQIMAITFIKFRKTINLHIQETQQTLSKETWRKHHQDTS